MTFGDAFLFFAAGVAVGAGAVWIAWTRCRRCPAMSAVHHANDLLVHKTDAYRSLCHDALTGVELLAVHAAAIQANHPSPAADKFMDAAGNLRAMLMERQSSKDFTPFQELVQIEGLHG
jgi:hypothetical protein